LYGQIIFEFLNI